MLPNVNNCSGWIMELWVLLFSSSYLFVFSKFSPKSMCHIDKKCNITHKEIAFVGLAWMMSTVDDFPASISTQLSGLNGHSHPIPSARDEFGSGHVTQSWPVRYRENLNGGPLKRNQRWMASFLPPDTVIFSHDVMNHRPKEDRTKGNSREVEPEPGHALTRAHLPLDLPPRATNFLLVLAFLLLAAKSIRMWSVVKLMH